MRRLYAAPYRLAEIASRALDISVFACASDGWIDELTAAFYERPNLYLSEEHNRSGLSASEQRCVDAHFPPSGRVLITSAGAGREARAFLREGWQVVATECAAAPAARLKEACGPAEVHCIAPDAVPDGTEPFGAIVIGFSAYSHLQGRDRRIAFLRRLATLLDDGAPLLLSYLATPAIRRIDRAVAFVANVARRPLGRRPIEPGEVVQSACYYRFFLQSEVVEELAAAGFEVVYAETTVHGYVVARRAPSV